MATIKKKATSWGGLVFLSIIWLLQGKRSLRAFLMLYLLPKVQRFSESAPRPAASISCGYLLEMQRPGPIPSLFNQKLEMKASDLWFLQAFQVSQMHAKLWELLPESVKKFQSESPCYNMRRWWHSFAQNPAIASHLSQRKSQLLPTTYKGSLSAFIRASFWCHLLQPSVLLTHLQDPGLCAFPQPTTCPAVVHAEMLGWDVILCIYFEGGKRKCNNTVWHLW